MLKNFCNELEDMFFSKKIKRKHEFKNIDIQKLRQNSHKKLRDPEREICLSKEIGKSKEAEQNAI